MKRLPSRKELNLAFDIIRLIKSVYIGQVFISSQNLNISIAYDYRNSETTNKIFNRSYFAGISQILLPELTQAIIDVISLYEALKNKANTIEVLNNNQIMMYNDTSDDKWHVGIKVSDGDHEKLVGNAFSLFDNFYNTLEAISDGSSGDWKYSSVMCEREIVDRLINYETVTIRDSDADGVGIILTSKCFPNIKKCEGIQADFLYSESIEKFMTLVSSSFFENIVFRMLVDTLKC